MKLREMDFMDWVILAHVNAAVDALIVLPFKHPDPAIVGACCVALPTVLGIYHYFLFRDAKQPDAGAPP